MDKPTFYFVAHVRVKYNTGQTQYQKFKDIMIGATHTDIIRYEDRQYLTFIAHFDTKQDFKLYEGRLRACYAGKSKVLAVHHSTKNIPTFYYSAYILPNLTTSQKHYGFYDKKKAAINAALALVTPMPQKILNNYECSVLVGFENNDLRPEDIQNINRVMQEVPHHTFMTSRDLAKKENDNDL